MKSKPLRLVLVNKPLNLSLLKLKQLTDSKSEIYYLFRNFEPPILIVTYVHFNKNS